MKNKVVTIAISTSLLLASLTGCSIHANIDVAPTATEEVVQEISDEDTMDEESAEEIANETDIVDDASEVIDEVVEDSVESFTKEDVVGNYIHTATEEIEGEEIRYTDLLIFQEDQRMFSLVQDLVTYGWYVDDNGLTVEDSSCEYTYSVDTDSIIVDMGNGITCEYVRAATDDEDYINAKAEFDLYCSEGFLYQTDHWKANYNPYALYAWTDEANEGVTFSYCQDGVEISGSQTVTISFVPDKKSDEVLTELKEKNEEQSAKSELTYFGAKGQKSYSYSVGSTRSDEEEGVKIRQSYTAIDVEGGTVLVDSFSTLGNDEDTAMKIDSAFEALLGTFEAF